MGNILACPNCGSVSYIKKGYYKTKHNHQSVPRYKCKDCACNFSSHSNRETFKQHRPELNENVFKLSSSSVTMRRMAIILGCARGTIERKLNFISKVAKDAHEERIKLSSTHNIHFDEMETFLHTKLKPLSIALAVDSDSLDILSASVAQMRCKGKLAEFGHKKYPEWCIDNRSLACSKVIEEVKKISPQIHSITSDAKKSYPSIFKKNLPDAEIFIYKSRKTKKGEFNPLFQLNHAAAKIRSDLSIMRRRTWACTKKISNLQRHLDIYIAWNNGYSLNLNFC